MKTPITLLALALLVTAAPIRNSFALAAENTAAQMASPLDIPATDDGLPGSGPIRRSEGFRKLWHERRAKWAGEVQKDQGALVFLGDSITQGWHDDIGGSFPGVKVANRGISGDTSRGVLIRLKEDVLALHPRGVVLLIGTNDLSDQAQPWTIASNVRLIIDALKQADAAMPVVLCEVFPSSDVKNRPSRKIRRLNQVLSECVRDQPQVTFLETWKLFADAKNDAKPDEFPDLLHPNAVGYAKWAAALRPVLATLGFVDTEADAFAPEEGFVSLFNGHDLTGWGYRPTTEEDKRAAKQWQSSDVNAAEWPVVSEAVNFDGRTSTPDGRFVAKNGRLVVTTPIEHRKVQQLWTTREFPRNFELRLEFRATPLTDSGVYLRGPQLQCRDYGLAGPYYKLQHYKPQDWNELVVVVKDGVAHCTCNGEVVEAAMKLPATGPIGVEGDRGQMEYRRMRLREM